MFPGGKAGTDYNYYISTQFQQAGELWGKWLDTALHCKGNVVNLGGPPANSQSLAEYQGLKKAIASCPGIHIIGQTPYYVTNWDPAQTQKVVTAVLAKYPKIDAITTDFGAALASAFSAFSQANRKIPAIATEDSNQLSCDQKEASNFPLFTVDSQNWMVRTAVDFAVAKATGGTMPSSTVVPQKAFEDSLTGKPHPVECAPSLPSDAILSSHLSHSAAEGGAGRVDCHHRRIGRRGPTPRGGRRETSHRLMTDTLPDTTEPPTSHAARTARGVEVVPRRHRAEGSVTVTCRRRGARGPGGERGGKSTLMSVASGAIAPDSGSILIGERELWPPDARRGPGPRRGHRAPAPRGAARPDRGREPGAGRDRRQADARSGCASSCERVGSTTSRWGRGWRT